VDSTHAAANKMIEPFRARQVRESEKGRVISYGNLQFGYDVRCKTEVSNLTNVAFPHGRPEEFFDEKALLTSTSRRLYLSRPNFVLRWARTVGIFSHSPQCADHLPGASPLCRCGIIVNVHSA